ncbi:outer membrane protein assembly factor BamC [Chromatiaceae bacterium AAb-1]|nr:outer membrane protein assembly factor BamC [Chromatiaceae bacterium AAb-1]
MHYWAKSVVVASILLTGCSLFSSDQVESSRNEPSAVDLKIPQGLSSPARPGQYDIPPVAAEPSAVTTRAPALILATAASSRIEEEEKLARVWFERNEYTDDLVPFVQQNISSFFSQQNTSVQTSSDGLRYETDWITQYDETGFWFWKSQQPREQARYLLNIEPRPHGRTASLTVKMLEHQYFQQGGALNSADQRRQEIDLLNQVINAVAVTEVEIARANRAREPEMTLEAGMDASGNAVLLTAQSVDVAWTQLEQLFPALNLAVTDINRSVLTYYVTYSKPERGFWSRLWGSATMPELPLAEGDYQVVLSRNGNGAAISFRDNEGQLLPANVINELYDPIVSAVRSARIEL